jgi:hypothetical protein
MVGQDLELRQVYEYQDSDLLIIDDMEFDVSHHLSPRPGIELKNTRADTAA